MWYTRVLEGYIYISVRINVGNVARYMLSVTNLCLCTIDLLLDHCCLAKHSTETAKRLFFFQFLVFRSQYSPA